MQVRHVLNFERIASALATVYEHLLSTLLTQIRPSTPDFLRQKQTQTEEK